MAYLAKQFSLLALVVLACLCGCGRAQNVCSTSNSLSYQKGQDCSSYIQCEQGEATTLTCPKDTYWNQEATKCDQKEKVADCATAKLAAESNEAAPTVAKPAEMNEPAGGESHQDDSKTSGGEAHDESGSAPQEETSGAGGGAAAGTAGAESTGVEASEAGNQEQASGTQEGGEEAFLPLLLGAARLIPNIVKGAQAIGKGINAANNANNAVNAAKNRG